MPRNVLNIHVETKKHHSYKKKSVYRKGIHLMRTVSVLYFDVQESFPIKLLAQLRQ